MEEGREFRIVGATVWNEQEPEHRLMRGTNEVWAGNQPAAVQFLLYQM